MKRNGIDRLNKYIWKANFLEWLTSSLHFVAAVADSIFRGYLYFMRIVSESTTNCCYKQNLAFPKPSFWGYLIVLLKPVQKIQSVVISFNPFSWLTVYILRQLLTMGCLSIWQKFLSPANICCWHTNRLVESLYGSHRKTRLKVWVLLHAWSGYVKANVPDMIMK